MHEASFSKRVFALAVVAMTILWSVGAFVAPLLANAQVSLSAGNLVKGQSFPTVYYFDGDARWTFADEGTFFSWYNGFSNVVTISDAQLAGISIAGNVVRRPGTRWVKIQSDPATYAVTPNGTLRWIETEEVATALYGGSAWNTFIDDVHDTSFGDYTLGASLMSANMLYDGALVSNGTNTYLYWGGQLRQVTSTGMSANGLQSRHVLNTNVSLAGMSMGSSLSAYSAEISDTVQMAEGDAAPVTGSLSVSLASDTPAGVTVPAGANGVQVARWRFTAGSEAARINTLTVGLQGVSATSNIANVYLYEGNTRLTEGRSINSATREATFSNLNLDIAAGQSRTFTLRLESSSSISSGQTVAFSIKSASAVGSAGTVSGSFPLAGNLFTFSSESVGTVTVYKNGSINNPQIGAQDAVIGQFRIAADSEAASCSYFRFEVDNAADHSDYRLWNGSTELAQGVKTGTDGVVFDLGSSPFAIAEGGNTTFKISADVSGDNGDAIKVYIDRDTDLICAGGDYGFNMMVDRGDDSGSGTYDGTSCTTTSGQCSYSTLEGGDITFTFNGPSAANLPIDSQDQVFMNFTLTTATDITIDSFPIRVGSDDGDGGDNDPLDGVGDSTSDNEGLIRSTTEANLKDIKIVNTDTGVTVMGPLELSLSGDDALQVLQFTEDVFVSAGTTMHLAVTADIDNNMPTTSGDNYYAVALDLDGTGATFRIEDTNGDAVSSSDISPSSDLNGNVFTMQSPALAIALASSPAAGTHTYVQGATNVEAIGFTFTATAEDITVTQILVSVYGDSEDDSPVGSPAGDDEWIAGGASGYQVEDFIASCSLYDGSNTLLDGPVSPSNSGEDLLFDNIRWTVPADEVRLVKVVCNLQNPSDTDTDYFAFSIDDADAEVVAEDEDGSSLGSAITGDNSNQDISTATTAASTIIAIAASGSLSVASDSSTPNPMILTAGTNDNFVSAFRFTATNEPFLVERLAFSEVQGPVDDVSSNGAIYSNNIAALDIQYPDEQGVTRTSTAYMSSNIAKFSGLTFYVPTSSSKTVNVFVDVPQIDRNTGGSATSGEKIKIGLIDEGGTDDSHFRAVGQGSGTVLNESNISDTNPSKGAHVVRETMPTVKKHASSPSGGSTPGVDKDALIFTIAAGASEDVVVSQMVFSVNTGSASTAGNTTVSWDECDSDAPSSGLVGTKFTLVDANDTSDPLEGSDSDWTALISTGAVCSNSDQQVKFVRLRFATASDRLVIGKGTTKTYHLRVNTTGASTTNDDTIEVGIPADPIVSTFLDSGIDADGGNTSLATSIDTDANTAITHGDLVCFSTADTTCDSGEEIGLTTNVDSGDNTVLYVYRGYLNRANLAVANNANILRMPSSFVWQDDGDQTNTTTAYEDEVAGSYLVKDLPVNGNVLVF